MMCLRLPCLFWTPSFLAIEYRDRAEEGLPPYTVSAGGLRIILWGGTSTPLLLQWPERIQTEVLGAQNSAENPESLGWKRSYAPFVSTDGTEPSQVGNQTKPPHSEPQQDPPWGHGVRGWEETYNSHHPLNATKSVRVG